MTTNLSKKKIYQPGLAKAGGRLRNINFAHEMYLLDLLDSRKHGNVMLACIVSAPGKERFFLT